MSKRNLDKNYTELLRCVAGTGEPASLVGWAECNRDLVGKTLAERLIMLIDERVDLKLSQALTLANVKGAS